MGDKSYVLRWEEVVVENLQLKSDLSELKAELAELKRLIFGRRSERFVSDQPPAEQLNLFVQHDPQLELETELSKIRR